MAGKDRPGRISGDQGDGLPQVSRRSLLGAAGVGAAGLAAGAFGGLAAAQAATGHTPRPAHQAAAAPAAPQRAQADQAPDAGEHVVVHVRSGRDGDIDVYRGTTQTRLHDPELVTRLRRAAQ